MQLDGEISSKVLSLESKLVQTLIQSPGGRIFHFHNLFAISLNYLKIKWNAVLGRPWVTPNFSVILFVIKWLLQLDGGIFSKFLSLESKLVPTLIQSPGGRIFHFHNLFVISLNYLKIKWNVFLATQEFVNFCQSKT